MPVESSLSPRAARTRTALVTAGFDLLAVKPIDAIPIDEVVAKAGVAKGSFFNHFADKQAFAAAIATEVRLELEEEISRANRDVICPLERIAGGMFVGARFTIDHPKRTAVLLRSSAGVTARAHPLNKGVAEDFDEACERGLLREEARGSGVLYWLGLCQALMANLLERPRTSIDIARRVDEMAMLGLTGLGIAEARAAKIIAGSREGM